MQINTVKELVAKITDKVKEDISFEEYLFEKYPNLFQTDKDGKLLPQMQRCYNDCPKGWEKIVDNLCGCMSDYVLNTSTMILDPEKEFRYSLYKIWSKVRSKIDKLFNPYRKFRNKTLSKEQHAEIKNTLAAKVRHLTWKIDHKIVMSQKFYIKKPKPAVKIHQYKEKFGELRFYVGDSDENIDGMIRLAEYLCSKTCQDSGKEGRLRTKGGWWATLSDEKAKESGYKDI